MDRDTEIALIDELLGLRAASMPFVEDAVTTSPVARYTDPARFDAEMARLFGRLPLLAAHGSELPGEGDYLARDLAGKPVLLTRQRDGSVKAFLNVCRHRGARLIDTGSGCRHRFTCPYHAWTYDAAGRLIAAPHFEVGFTGAEKGDFGLTELPAVERFGCIWVVADPGVEADFDAWLDPLAADLAWAGLGGLEVFATDETVWNANWKILTEGGLESYHFRVAHARTIAGLFHDTLSTYQMLGPHFRSILPRRTIDTLAETPRGKWHIREHANVLYSVLPNANFLVQGDHVVMIVSWPLAVDRSLTRISTLRPKGELTAKARSYWEKNHALSKTTLDEDFALGEAIQAGVASGANDAFTFGRFEGALARFNAEVEARIG